MIRLTLATACLFLAAISSSARAQIIISDNFDNGSSHGDIAGRSPQTDLPDSKWAVSRDFSTTATSGGDYYAWVNTPGFADSTGPSSTAQANALFIWNGVNNPDPGSGAATISLASSGMYIKPPILTLSADIYTADLASGTNGALLGFYSAPPTNSQDSLTNFFGFMVGKTGQLYLVQNGVVGSAVAFTGTYNDEVFNTLTFSVNTATGAISGVSFAGNTTYSFSSTSFTGAATAYAGIGMEAPSNNSFAYVDNFTVTGAPEPSTWALLAGGVGALLFFQKRRAARA